MKNTIRLLLVSSLLSFCASCDTEKKANVSEVQTVDSSSSAVVEDSAQLEKFSILAPLPNVKVSPTIQSIHADSGDTLTFSSGSRIVVPASSLVDESGKKIKGEVEISFTEYSDAASILISGIPMMVMDKGKVEHFRSAGMFSIEAKYQGKPVKIAEGAEVKVFQATSEKKGAYDFFRLAENGTGWQKLGTSQPMELPSMKEQKEITAEKNVPVKPLRTDPDEFTFDMEIDTWDFPELKSLKGIVWQSAREKGYPDPEKDQDKIFSHTWYDVKLSPFKKSQSKYLLELSDGTTKYSTVVVPTLNEKEYEKAMKDFEEKMAQFERDKRALANKKKIEKKGEDIVRAFSISSFGIYNYDIINTPLTRMEVKATFMKKGAPFIPSQAYLVSRSASIVIKYTSGGISPYSRFVFDKSDTYTMIVIDEEGKVGKVSSAAFAKVTSSNEPSVGFEVQMLSKEIKDAQGLRAVLD